MIRYDRPVNNDTYSHAIISGVFSKEECQQIIDLGNKLDLSAGKLEDGSVSYSRHSKVGFFIPEPENDWVFKRIKEVAEMANDQSFQMELNFFNSIQFTKYEIGDYFDWHMDLILENVPFLLSRKLSMSVILSDPSSFEGGDLLINRTSLNMPVHTVKQEQGAVVLFPAFVHHKVTKVEKGERYSLVAWMEGNKFK